jgi:mannosyl-oligosaccharide alpha-1,3-glucosidase
MERNRDFTDNNFPLDVLWMDIEWSDQYNRGAYEYFIFNPANFTAAQIDQMNKEIEESNRRIVVIVDPHIKVSSSYPVYSNGQNLENAEQPEGNLTNIFIRDQSNNDFVGWCWPGNSVWIDFLNENAQSYWG